jgi:hypothetical protein
LKLFFSHGEFLRFIERAIFDEGFKLSLESAEENYMERNRAKLLNYMNQRRVYTSHKGIRM